MDWLCLPRFDSRSVFARLLDDRAGHWSVRPAGDFTRERGYADQAMVMQSVFRTAGGGAMLTDALALGGRERGHELGGNVPHTLLREVTCSSGEVEVALGSAAPRVRPGDPAVVRAGSAAYRRRHGLCPAQAAGRAASRLHPSVRADRPAAPAMGSA